MIVTSVIASTRLNEIDKNTDVASDSAVTIEHLMVVAKVMSPVVVRRLQYGNAVQ